MPFSAMALRTCGVGVCPVGGQERAVLDHVDAGGDHVGDSGRGVGVRGDRQPVAVRLVHGGAQLVDPVLGLVGAGGGGKVPATGHDLDDVNAAFGVVADGGPHGGRAVCLAVCLAAEEPAVSTGGCDRRASYQQVRACGGVGGGVVPQPQGQVVAVTEVADRGDPGHQAGMGGEPHPFQDRVVGIGDVTYRVVAGGTDTVEQAGGTDREHESSPTAGATGARRGA